MSSPSDLLNSCIDLAKNVSSQVRGVKFNKTLCQRLARSYVHFLKDLKHEFSEDFSMDPRHGTTLLELRRIMLCGQILVTQWTQEDWWMSVLTSSDSALVHQKVALHLREFFECTKVLLQIKRCIMYRPVSHLWHADAQKTFRIDVNSLISSIEDKRGQFSTSEFEKLAHCLLDKLKAETSSHEHPYKIDISRDVEILYEHNLGSGSFGAVYKCKFLGVLAAAKVFHPNCTDMQAVEKEAKLFSELRHPNVVQFIGYGVKEYRPVIVSELMSKDLRTYLGDEKKNAGQGPPLPLLVAINIMLQVAEAMNYLHEMGVIHRDLKATNVLINVLEDQDGRLSSTSVQTKLADFGESKSKLHDSGFTTRQVGTTRWRAPEVFEDEANREKYTKSADVYSFAMLFFEVLTGEIPFKGVLLTNFLQCIRNGMRPPLPPVEYCPGYLSALIEKCWATNPAERPQFPKISQLLVCCKNLILMHACPSPQIFFMHFDVTGKGHSHPELGHSHPEFFLYRVNDYGSIHGKGSVSRGGMSEDWKLSYGVSTLNVREVSMKDFDGNMITSINGQVIGYFGLLDQHINASNLSKQLRTQLFADLLKYPQSFYDPKVPIVEIYNKIDQDYCRRENSPHHAARLKASICVLVGNRLVVANVGDSRAVICAHGEAIALSTDQASYRAPTNIEGGVLRYNHWTVRAGSGASDAFGVQQLWQYVVTKPEIQRYTIEEGVDFLVLATAGLWSVVSNQDAVSMVESIPDAENAANRLVEEACRRGSLDDVTCVVVRFHHNA